MRSSSSSRGTALDTDGNDGPGPDLTDVGTKLPRDAILRTLENPTAPMPSYRELPEEKKAALVAFLTQLKGEEGEEATGTGGRGSPEGGGP